MSNNKSTQLAKIIEFLHRRGYANGKEDPSMLVIELAQLAWDCNWDVDKFMEEVSIGNPDFVDYGFNKRSYLKSITTEIFNEADEAYLNELNSKLFNFQGGFKSLGMQWKSTDGQQSSTIQNDMLNPLEP